MNAVSAPAGSELPAIFARRESEVRSYCRSFPALFTSARGAVLRTADGRSFLDFLCGAGTLNYGHNPPEVSAALIAYLQSDGVVHSLDLHTQAKASFLEAFERLVLHPRGYDHKVQFTGPTGANAVEAAFKIARKVTGRRGIVAFTNGYHGLSLGSLAATANRWYRDVAGTALPDVHFAAYDGYHGQDIDTLALLERQIDDPSGGIGLPAAIVVESVQGEGGVNVASLDWLRRLAYFCRRRGILLILDDIQAGNGRTGTFFSCEPAGIVPDLIALSKSIGGGLPLSLLLLRPAHDRWQPAEHTGTFRGNNLAFVAGRTVLETWWSDARLMQAVAARSLACANALERIAAVHPSSGLTPRGRGLMRGLACREHALARRISSAAFARGLIVECAGAHDEVIKLLPPLTITAEELDRGMAILADAVTAAIAESPNRA